MSTIIDVENTYTSGVYGKRQIAIVRGKGALLWMLMGMSILIVLAVTELRTLVMDAQK
jgi:hypothetical protein